MVNSFPTWKVYLNTIQDGAIDFGTLPTKLYSLTVLNSPDFEVFSNAVTNVQILEIDCVLYVDMPNIDTSSSHSYNISCPMGDIEFRINLGTSGGPMGLHHLTLAFADDSNPLRRRAEPIIGLSNLVSLKATADGILDVRGLGGSGDILPSTLTSMTPGVYTVSLKYTSRTRFSTTATTTW